MPDKKPVITIGIPCYSSVPPEVLQDYMRFMYYLGRRYQEYDFALAIKTKSEQFRARNAIVEAAYQIDSDYLLMLDDDHIIDTDDNWLPSAKYEFLRKLIEHDKDWRFVLSPGRGVSACSYEQGRKRHIHLSS
jgi:hypothetical protein